jgi:enoyl-CoA hydratase
MSADESDPVLYDVTDGIARITLNREKFANAQNSALLYRLDERFAEFANDDDARVAVLSGKGRHFSSGHDLGVEADRDTSFPRRSLWWDHVGKQGVENRLAREQDVYLGLCRRWRELPKPTIAMVRGACVAGGLMLAWSCDLITASTDAYFADPTVAMGVPGVEFFAHPWIMGGRRAKEFLFLGERIFAEQAKELAMVNRVYEPDELEEATMTLAARISRMPRMGLAFAKMAVNQSEDAMGMRVGIDSVFGLHHAAHAHNVEVSGSPILGQSPDRVRRVIEGTG